MQQFRHPCEKSGHSAVEKLKFCGRSHCEWSAQPAGKPTSDASGGCKVVCPRIPRQNSCVCVPGFLSPDSPPTRIPRSGGCKAVCPTTVRQTKTGTKYPFPKQLILCVGGDWRALAIPSKKPPKRVYSGDATVRDFDFGEIHSPSTIRTIPTRSACPTAEVGLAQTLGSNVVAFSKDTIFALISLGLRRSSSSTVHCRKSDRT